MTNVYAMYDHWDYNDGEKIRFYCFEDAVDDYLDMMWPLYPSESTTLTVTAYKRPEIKIENMQILETALNWLDENYGDWEEGPTEPTDAMVEAAKVFAEVLKKEYDVWTLEPAYEEEVNLLEYLEKNHPEWLEDAIKAKDLQDRIDIGCLHDTTPCSVCNTCGRYNDDI